MVSPNPHLKQAFACSLLQVGSVTNTFNVPGVEENCFFLKDMEGAKALRQRINECFEISALPSTSPEERRRLLPFVVVRPTAAACGTVVLLRVHTKLQDSRVRK